MSYFVKATHNTVTPSHAVFEIGTNLAEVVAGEGSLAHLSVELEQVPREQLQDLTAVQAELVRGGGDGVLAADLGFAGLRQVGQFLGGGSARGDSEYISTT